MFFLNTVYINHSSHHTTTNVPILCSFYTFQANIKLTFLETEPRICTCFAS